ncbi:hypothetical protein GQ54DRAFT_199508 [Martensiomyces pterosporus]|nr:hypothetical protein GQ54DRAFT_199508 [Martensiomyces pterosporus]
MCSRLLFRQAGSCAEVWRALLLPLAERYVVVIITEPSPSFPFSLPATTAASLAACVSSVLLPLLWFLRRVREASKKERSGSIDVVARDVTGTARRHWAMCFLQLLLEISCRCRCFLACLLSFYCIRICPIPHPLCQPFSPCLLTTSRVENRCHPPPFVISGSHCIAALFLPPLHAIACACTRLCYVSLVFQNSMFLDDRLLYLCVLRVCVCAFFLFPCLLYYAPTIR